MSIFWYDRAGKPFPGIEAKTGSKKWVKAMEHINDLLTSDYKIVQQDYTRNKRFWVSTVWLGLDHSFLPVADVPNPLPLIFETMIFDTQTKTSIGTHDQANFGELLTMLRYHTEEAAKTGHAELLRIAQEYEDSHAS